jgi:hypothetical protein
MTADEFRRLALNLPEVVEGSHMGHADFRVGGKVFATLGYPDERYGAAMLTPQDQDLLVKDHPKTFAPAAGAWGASGSTHVLLRGASKRAVAIALEAAWRKRAPKGLSIESRGKRAPSAPRTAKDCFARVRRLGLELADVEEATSWGAPALKVRGKMFACVPTNKQAEPESVVFRLSFVERDLRLDAEPDNYYLKPHYVNYPCVLARVKRLSDGALKELLETSWRFVQTTGRASKAGSQRRPRSR